MKRLRKGCGYHLDLLVLAVIVVVSSVFGLPWFIANTIPSINHIQSLIKESSTSIPGEKPQFLGVREQRLTSLMIAILTGFTVLISPILALIPMPVLYGVFLFMGVMALRGLQFFDRILLLFMPTKFQPNFFYLKFVQLSRVHLFTIIQILTMAVLWGIKSYNKTSIAFPVMLVVICIIRKVIECIFSHQELRALDDLLPERKTSRRKSGVKKTSLKRITESEEDHNRSVDSFIVMKRKKRNQNAGYDPQLCLDEELEDLMSYEPKPPKYKKEPSVTNIKSMVRAPSLPEKVILMFLRMCDEEVYIPIHLSPVSYSNLVRTLRDRFDQLRDKKVETKLSTKLKLSFYLDHKDDAKDQDGNNICSG